MDGLGDEGEDCARTAGIRSAGAGRGNTGDTRGVGSAESRLDRITGTVVGEERSGVAQVSACSCCGERSTGEFGLVGGERAGGGVGSGTREVAEGTQWREGRGEIPPPTPTPQQLGLALPFLYVSQVKATELARMRAVGAWASMLGQQGLVRQGLGLVHR